MISTSFWSKCRSNLLPSTVSAKSRRAGRLRTLVFEPLEDRRVLSAMSPVESSFSDASLGPGKSPSAFPPEPPLDPSFIPYNPDFEGLDDNHQVAGAFLVSTSYGDTRAASFNDIKQGQLDTCSFAAVLSAVARTSFNLSSKIVANAGGFNVQLFGANLQAVSIFVPSSQAITADDLRPADDREVWTTIYQRAFLTLQQQLGRDYHLEPIREPLQLVVQQ